MSTQQQNELVNAVLAEIESQSHSIDELPLASTLEGVNSLPAKKGNEMVLVPIAKLAEPATEAAKTANAAAQTANQAASSADNAAQTATQAAQTATQAAQTANQAAQAATEATQTILQSTSSEIVAENINLSKSEISKSQLRFKTIEYSSFIQVSTATETPFHTGFTNSVLGFFIVISYSQMHEYFSLLGYDSPLSQNVSKIDSASFM